MAYTCRDCSFSGNKPSAQGGCPACGSGNFGSRAAATEDEQAKGSSPMKLAMMAALWGWFIFEVHSKLSG